MKRPSVKAGALQLTLFIVVVIALLLGAFILILYTNKTFKAQTSFTIETIRNADKGIQHLLQNTNPKKDTVTVPLENPDFKQLKVHTTFWGVFEKLTALASIKNKTFAKQALAGAQQSPTNRFALYLEDHHKPFVVVGDTKIQGTVYVPEQGVRTGNISGHSYYREKLIYGASKTSHQLPKIEADILNQLEKLPKMIQHISADAFLDINKHQTFQNSFHQPTQVIYNQNDITLIDKTITGNIIIQSETKITIDASSTLTDVILMAPSIQIKNKVQGVFQAVASENIVVGEECTLSYPSALILDQNNKTSISDASKDISAIQIQKGTHIKGIVAYVGRLKNYHAQVFIAPNAFVTGQVYCSQNLELLGTVYGTVYTSNFVAHQNGSSYQNHIYNGHILNDSLPQEYIGLLLENSKKGVAKWLY
ncbi:hypothetical protein QVZ41_08710 [Wenyingzhuangia sp. chi5]|uniref:Cytoskeletal protein CcmA (Bactofilin family) n=1 Tax=Wenyingzhuangia gilva TaxID=3057677 RepID=A0ABT8VSK5_9FLAO|nr:hypothetical protein [Wenyingzhuangia sp. chi5]MDO3694922.1 hypothetical protein [Wenyingzhuangia sp. chi5]